jgi:hypothetical protein
MPVGRFVSWSSDEIEGGRMMKAILVGAAMAAAILLTVLFQGRELDDASLNGPIDSEVVQAVERKPMFEGVLAAGIAWDFDQDRFFISTDQPHSLMSNQMATFYVVNAALDRILYQQDFLVDGDLEGIAYIGDSEVAIMSETGTLYFLREEGSTWVGSGDISIFVGQGRHKLSSLAYDADNDVLYSAEKEGAKIIYKISRTGTLLESFELSVSATVSASRPFDLATDYTIAGMTYEDGYLYILSEAYSTIFQYSLEQREAIRVFGVTGIHESAGITLRQGVAYLAGDEESYLPPPQFYVVELPE